MPNKKYSNRKLESLSQTVRMPANPGGKLCKTTEKIRKEGVGKGKGAGEPWHGFVEIWWLQDMACQIQCAQELARDTGANAKEDL